MISVDVSIPARQCLNNLTTATEYVIGITAPIPNQTFIEIANMWISEMDEGIELRKQSRLFVGTSSPKMKQWCIVYCRIVEGRFSCTTKTV